MKKKCLNNSGLLYQEIMIYLILIASRDLNLSATRRSVVKINFTDLNLSQFYRAHNSATSWTARKFQKINAHWKIKGQTSITVHVVGQTKKAINAFDLRQVFVFYNQAEAEILTTVQALPKILANSFYSSIYVNLKTKLTPPVLQTRNLIRHFKERLDT